MSLVLVGNGVTSFAERPRQTLAREGGKTAAAKRFRLEFGEELQDRLGGFDRLFERRPVSGFGDHDEA
jgi:hypothetical protein